MKTYLVGGAVRDRVLGLPVKEKDWVVVGATVEEMLAQGFTPVGKAFPVFLHPDTKEEYALARTEKKVGKGYQGFTFYTDPSVTLEQDLSRRDLTINAIAQDPAGNLVDPCRGQQDLNHKVLRHVTDAFAEDPVRILRIARFAAKLPDFTVHPDTNVLMQKLVADGEVDALVSERVWQELYKALKEKAPWRFFEVLHECGADSILFPGFKLDKVLLQQACQKTDNPAIRLAVAWHAVGSISLKLPNDVKQAVVNVQKHLATYKDLDNSAPAILALLKSVDAMRRPDNFKDFVWAATLCTGADHSEALNKALEAVNQIDTSDLKSIEPSQIKSTIEQRQLEAIEKIL